MLKKILISATIILSGELSSNEIKFLPHMVDHVHIGCPRNSACHSSYGTKRKKFNQSLSKLNNRRNFFKKHGAPFRFFISANNISNLKDFARWDSHCGHLRLRKEPILEVETFTKNLPTIEQSKNKKNIIAKNLYLLKNKKLKKFSIPLNGDLTNIRKGYVIFTVKEQSGFFNYSVNSAGKISVSNNTVEDKFSFTQCPKVLKELYETMDSSVFLTYYCKQDSMGNTVLLPKACN